MIPRIIENKLINSPKSILLLGPRQVGKSTICKKLNPTININLADQKVFIEHSKDPGLVTRIADAQEHNSLIFVDEVQRIPSMLNSIQALIDKVPSRKFLLTGSSARKLKRGNANLLPGRIFVENLSPLLFWELDKKNFNLEDALRLGTLPEVYLNDYGQKLLETYVDTYLREEIQAEAATKDIGAYSRFLDLAAELSGQYLNYSKIASDSEIKKETVRRYFQILEDTLIVERIQSYTNIKNKRRARQKDRFVFFDIGVRNVLLNRHLSLPIKSELGHLFEQWIYLQILNYSRVHDKSWNLYSFSTVNDQEVDLLVETKDQLIAIEIKYRDKIDEKMSKNLVLFEKISERNVSKYIVYTGNLKQKFPNGTVGIPYKEFLRDIVTSL